MKTYADHPFDTYEPSGCEVRIHWNIKEVPAPSMDDEARTQWEANEAVCGYHDDRGTLISTIIRSEYSLDRELAAMNNRDEEPEQYAEFQAFRVLAKTLADGWIEAMGLKLADETAAEDTGDFPQ